MNNSDIAAKWPIYSHHLKKEFPHLTDEDLKLELGKEEETLLRIQEKVHKTNEEIRNWLSLLG